MNHLVARQLMRGLTNGPKCNRYVLCSATRVEIWDQRGSFGRMMSTETSLAEKNQKEKPVEQVEKKNEVTVSSYWGILRPRITREDGTPWPWNCFMVTICLSFFYFSFLLSFSHNSVIIESGLVLNYGEFSVLFGPFL